MSINIKEIFQSDNLQVTQDKINYNFDQVLANGGGPQGLKGEKGSTGAIGSVGAIGPKGDKGNVGSKGDTGSSGYWELDAASGSYTNSVLPKINPSGSGAGTKATNIIVGMDDTTYVADAIDKDALISLINGDSGSDFSDMIRLRLFDGVDYSDSSFAVRLSPNAGGVHFKLIGIGAENIAEIQSEEIRFTDANSVTRIKINDTNTEIVGDVNFVSSDVVLNTASTLTNNGTSSLLGTNNIGATGKVTTIIGSVRINPTASSPADNKILASTDTNGNSTWRFPYQISGIYPLHAIVFVNPADITDTNFFLTTGASVTTAGASYKRYGRGRAGTRWQGWYLLFGQTNAWYTTSNVLNSYVPTNVPGSILVGASAPQLTDTDNDSSMSTSTFRPPTGYGTLYDPTLKGDFNGEGSSTQNSEPGDLLVGVGGSSGVAADYDILTSDALQNVGLAQAGPGGSIIYSNMPALMPLPMAVYLGSSDLIYDFVDLTTPGGAQGVAPPA
jgi:hypothetical protein